MQEIRFCYGTHVCNFFVLPAILVSSIEQNDGTRYTFYTIEWLSWYVGIVVRAKYVGGIHYGQNHTHQD